MRASLLYNNNKVHFNLIQGEYQNIIVFLEVHDILFVAEMHLDLDTIPIVLHGRGRSYNLYEYLSNNNNDYKLISNFISYFISDIIKIKYEDDSRISFHIIDNVQWQNMLVIIQPQPPVTTNFLVTESRFRIVTEKGDYVIVGRL